MILISMVSTLGILGLVALFIAQAIIDGSIAVTIFRLVLFLLIFGFIALWVYDIVTDTSSSSTDSGSDGGSSTGIKEAVGYGQIFLGLNMLDDAHKAEQERIRLENEDPLSKFRP